MSSSSIAVCYRYPRPALLNPQLIRLRPADHVRARVERYQLQIAPEPRRRLLSRLRDRDVVERVYGVLDVAGRSIFLLGTIHNSKEQQQH